MSDTTQNPEAATGKVGGNMGFLKEAVAELAKPMPIPGTSGWTFQIHLDEFGGWIYFSLFITPPKEFDRTAFDLSDYEDEFEQNEYEEARKIFSELNLRVILSLARKRVRAFGYAIANSSYLKNELLESPENETWLIAAGNLTRNGGVRIWERKRGAYGWVTEINLIHMDEVLEEAIGAEDEYKVMFVLVRDNSNPDFLRVQ